MLTIIDLLSRYLIGDFWGVLGCWLLKKPVKMKNFNIQHIILDYLKDYMLP